MWLLEGTIMSRDFSAGESVLGYLYQSRYALYLLLTRIDSNITIEKLDDITFEEGFSPIELLQLKHHVNSTASLTNSCPDLWRTARIWCDSLSQIVHEVVPAWRNVFVMTVAIPMGMCFCHLLWYNDCRKCVKCKGAMMAHGSRAIAAYKGGRLVY